MAICGEDFCEECGDCLSCYAEDDCAVSGEPHRYARTPTKPYLPNTWEPAKINEVPNARPGQGDKL